MFFLSSDVSCGRLSPTVFSANHGHLERIRSGGMGDDSRENQASHDCIEDASQEVGIFVVFNDYKTDST